MYILNNICSICMKKNDLKLMFDVDNDGVSHYNKLTSSIAEMNFKEMNDQGLICGECCVTLNTVYTFRQTCLRSKTNLITYISQLQTFGKVSGTLNVRLRDLKYELIVVKKEIEINCENEDNSSFEEYNPLIGFKIENCEESIHSSVKEECESEEDSSAHAVDHVNDEAHSDVKVEDVEHQTTMEDEYYQEFSEIDIKEDLLPEVKEEPMSDSETPQDSSTSQADEGNSGEPKEREGTTIGSELNQKDVGGPYICDKCGKPFDYMDPFIIHMRIHTGERPYECKICKKSYTCESNLNVHLKSHSGEKLNTCEICNKSFNYRSTLIQHMNIHSGEAPIECEICKKSFIKTNDFTEHMLTHSEARPFKCGVCKRGFRLKATLLAHMKTHWTVQPREKPIECGKCPKTFPTMCRLQLHFKVHIGRRPFQCKICEASFDSKGVLTRHMHIHSTRRPYECEICQKNFTAKRWLTKHMKNHFVKTII